MTKERRKTGAWRHGLKLLPKVLRYPLIRRNVSYSSQHLGQCTVRIAHSLQDYLDAFRLVHDAYVERGWIKELPCRLWVTSHHPLPESTVFVMYLGDECIGTTTVVADSLIGLPIDHTFTKETNALRKAGCRIGEIGSLALAKGHRRSGLGLVLMASVWRFIWARQELTDFVIAVSREVADYYCAIFNFSVYGRSRPYRGFGNAASAPENDLVTGLRQRLSAMHDFCRTQYSVAPGGMFNLRMFADVPFPAAFESPPPDNHALDFKRYKLPREVFRHVFIKHTDLIKSLDPLTRSYLARYRSPETLTLESISALHDQSHVNL